jgi:peptidoglycan/xylan/chitin deacetylase (PgdA/CDA1 family)
MWQNKNKAITFSFDDGVTQDERLIEILNKYNLKGTFNLNFELLGTKNKLERNGRIVSHDKIKPTDVKRIYLGHEVAGHTLSHHNVISLTDDEVIYHVEEDRKKLSDLCGYDVVGFAYPCGAPNNDERTSKIICEKTGIKYARTITSTYQFDVQSNLFRFNPSVYYIEKDFESVVDRFLETDAITPQLLYIWGHSYEMDAEYISWEKFESICKKLANRPDIFYGTNKQVLLGK